MAGTVVVEDADLRAAVADARVSYVAAHPTSRALHEKARRFLPGGNTRSVLAYDPFPIAMQRGQDCRLWDVDGHEYIDLCGEYTAGLFGHSEPQILSAVGAALACGINLAAVGANEGLLAQLICNRFPSIELVRFTNSGTEANLMALTVARAFTGREMLLAFNGGYHGGVLLFPVTGRSPMTVPFPHRTAGYNDIDSAVALILELGSRLAAVIVEPMLGAGGCIPADPKFLAELREATRDVGALLIFDEVMTSRMSSGGMQQRLGIRADLTSIGKYAAGGMTFGAFGGRRDIMEMFSKELPHAGTFNNNVLSMAAGLVALGEVFTPERAEQLFQLGEAMRGSLNGVLAVADTSTHFAGIGSLATIHFRPAPVDRPNIPTGRELLLRELFFFDMAEAGFYLAKRGMIALSLPITRAHIDRLSVAVEKFAKRRSAFLPRRKESA